MDDASTRTILRPRAPLGVVRVRVAAAGGGVVTREGRKLTLGRSPLADVPVADPTVSEFHLELAPHETGVEVRDLDSWNGTYFEGARLARAVVPRGAVLLVGETRIAVDVGPEGVVAPTLARDAYRGLVGRSAVMRELYALLERLAPTDLGALVEGPTGSGKELVARALHDGSPRHGGPFVVLDCAALPASLAESVLFGHAAGAFTGAIDARPGVFEAAEGGTVFLDEVGELPLDLQPKLLRVLEQRQVTRVGETRPRPVSVRVVSATWRDLRRMVNQGHFRDDLYFRLAQARVLVPALAERREDIELLVAELLRRLPRGAVCARSIAREALGELAARDFPGNVRELKNVVERAAYLAASDVIRPRDLAFEKLLERGREGGRAGVRAASDAPGALEDPGEVPEFKGAKRTAVDDFEHDYLARLMARTQGNLAMAAGLAGIERHYLRTLLRKHGLRDA